MMVSSADQVLNMLGRFMPIYSFTSQKPASLMWEKNSEPEPIASVDFYRDKNMLPIDPDVAPRVASLRPDGKIFRAVYLTPETILDSMPKWTKIFQDLFR